MESNSEYVTFGQIQQIKTDIFTKTGIGISFPDAIQLLCKQKKSRFGSPEKPDFLSWDLKDMDDFQKRTDRITVSLAEIQSVKGQILDRINYLSTRNEVQIGLESCYCPEEYISVDYFTVIYVMEGNCDLHTMSRCYSMKKGELCILPPKYPYYARTSPKDLVVNILSNRAHFEEQFRQLLYKDNLISLFFRQALFEDAREIQFFMVPGTKDFYSILQHLFAEFVSKDDYSESAFYSYLQILYTNIIRSGQTTLAYYGDQDDLTSRSLMPAVLQYITDHYRTVTLDDLSERFHFDSAYLSRIIKTSTGRNFARILTDLKLREAGELLADSSLSIETVAVRCGYHSADHFTYTFKKELGMTPSSYRKHINS